MRLAVSRAATIMVPQGITEKVQVAAQLSIRLQAEIQRLARQTRARQKPGRRR